MDAHTEQAGSDRQFALASWNEDLLGPPVSVVIIQGRPKLTNAAQRPRTGSVSKEGSERNGSRKRRKCLVNWSAGVWTEPPATAGTARQLRCRA